MGRETWFTITRTPMSRRKRVRIVDDANLWFPGPTTGCIDPNQERTPPPEATPTIFPHHKTSDTVAWDDKNPPPNHWLIFSKVLRPLDLQQSHLDALNFDLVEPVTFEDLLPPARPTGEPYIPSLDPETKDQNGSYAGAAKQDPAVARRDQKYIEQLNELKVENSLAYQTVCRAFTPGIRPPRLAHLRKFYEGLENMSRYWDTSSDNYYDIKIFNGSTEGEIKRQKTYAGALNDDLIQSSVHAASPESENHHLLSDIPLDEIKDKPEPEHEPALIPQRSRRYKGQRTSTGRKMPDMFLADTVRGFVESVMWSFSVVLKEPRVAPLVQLCTLNIPVRQTAAVYSVPQDRFRARDGCRDGPILGLQIRAGTNFSDDGSVMTGNHGRIDLLKEFGGLLQLAQERRREGKEEEFPGEGKWWKSNPRWGGKRMWGRASEGKAGDKPDNYDVLKAAEAMFAAPRDSEPPTIARRFRQTARPSRPLVPIETYPGFWDPKITYKATGKDHTRSVDEVFLISALNHHVSVLKLTIDDTYTDLLLTGKMPENAPSNPNWSKPQVERTAWYDLFDIDQRIELHRGLWGVTAYLLRDAVPSNDVR